MKQNKAFATPGFFHFDKMNPEPFFLRGINKRILISIIFRIMQRLCAFFPKPPKSCFIHKYQSPQANMPPPGQQNGRRSSEPLPSSSLIIIFIIIPA
jgi:hypothetical protein